MVRKKFSYYSFSNVLSYGGVYNMIMGARGLGKTYGAKKIVIRNAIEKGQQFIYLRRYKTELRGRNSFFADIQHEFPDQEFRVEGQFAQRKVDDKWETIGYFIPLSTAQANKSIAYPNVYTIIFDEFIIDKGSLRYLPDEAKVFMDFYSTVDRYQDRVRCLMLSNSVSIMNPYFIRFHIEPRAGITRHADGFIVTDFVDSREFANEVAHTRFGSFIINHAEDYADYSINNEFADNYDDFVMKKSGKAQYQFTLRTPQGTVSIWVDGGTWFAQKRLPRGPQVRWAYKVNDLREGERLLLYGDKILSIMRTVYRKGRLFSDSPETRNMFAEIFVR